MAKRKSDRLGDLAEDLGTLLGTTERKANEWLGQRKALAKKLSDIRDTADGLLRQLAGGAAAAVRLARGTQPGGRKKRSTRSRGAAAKKTTRKSKKAGGDSVGNG